jgi:thiamine biosynthesis lipoprotein
MIMSNISTVCGDYFDTINSISAWCSESILKEAMNECAKYNALLSKTVTGSDVWRINHAGGKDVAVSEKTMEILKTALEVSKASNGAFNIAVGSITKLWHFTDGTAVLPDENDIAAAVANADCTKIQLEGENIVTVPPDMQIDLGGIAKGYITDQIAGYLMVRGVNNAILNFGGNIVTVGSKPDGSPWNIGLQNPLGKRGKDYWAVVKSNDNSVVTSGVYERGFELNGKWYHHILDPRTGWPVRNDLLTVAVCSKSSMLADALATAMFVLGTTGGMQLAEKFGVNAVFLEKGNKITYTKELDIVFIK